MRHWTAGPALALLWLVSLPATAVAGYDIAHIVKRTCMPGGPLIVAPGWGGARREPVPGEVIACPPAGRGRAFQIAAGPERSEGDRVLCTYFSLLGADGTDLCVVPESAAGVQPLMVIQADRSDRLQLTGIAGEDVATVEAEPRAGEPTLIPIGRQRAARLGATRAFAYFSLPVERRALCGGELRVVGRDSSGRRIAESSVPATTSLLSVADRVPHARSLDGDLCEAPATSAWLTEMLAPVLRWLF